MKIDPVFKHESGAVELDRHDDILLSKWIGILDSDEIKMMAGRIIDLAASENTGYVVINQSGLKGSWQEAANWMLQNWFPALSETGVCKVAFVFPQDPYNRLILFMMLEKVKNITVKVFENQEDCFEWFRKSKNEPGNQAQKKDAGNKHMILQILQEKFEKQRIFLNPDLNLEKTASLISCHPKTLSRLLNRYYKRNFPQFINDFRIRYAKKLLENIEKKEFSYTSIGIKSGFSSKSSFYRIFKSETGLTPKKYKEQYNLSKVN